jgi:hypothetical protein
METGVVTQTSINDDQIYFVPEHLRNQPIARVGVKVRSARACLNCGFMELYVDPTVLRGEKRET